MSEKVKIPCGGFYINEENLEINDNVLDIKNNIILPEVTEEDNGDILTVVEGAWKKAVPSGGSDLPTVTNDDNGDVLTVVDGMWNKATPSGGGGDALIIEESIAVAGRYTKTYNEVYTAINNGTPCYVKKSVMAVGKYGVQLAPVLIAYRDTSDPNAGYVVNYMAYDAIIYSLHADTQSDYLEDGVA